jgi:hypothetical protein
MSGQEITNLQEYAEKIAGALGGTWQALPPDDRYWATIAKTDDPQCQLSVCNSSPRGKLNIRGCLPRAVHGYGNGLRYEEHVAEINVSPERPMAAIAKDIQRRLWPIYLEQLERSKAYVATAHDNDTKQKALDAAVEERIRAYNQAHPYSADNLHLYKKTVNAKGFYAGDRPPDA